MEVLKGCRYEKCKVKILHLFSGVDIESQKSLIIQTSNNVLSTVYKIDDNYDSFDDVTIINILDAQNLSKALDFAKDNYPELAEAALWNYRTDLRPEVVFCWGWSRSTYTCSMVKVFCEGILQEDTREVFKPWSEGEAIGVVNSHSYGEIFVFNFYAPNQSGFNYSDVLFDTSRKDGFLVYRKKIEKEAYDSFVAWQHIFRKDSYIAFLVLAALIGIIGNTAVLICTILTLFIVVPCSILLSKKEETPTEMLRNKKSQRIAILVLIMELIELGFVIWSFETNTIFLIRIGFSALFSWVPLMLYETSSYNLTLKTYRYKQDLFGSKGQKRRRKKTIDYAAGIVLIVARLIGIRFTDIQNVNKENQTNSDDGKNQKKQESENHYSVEKKDSRLIKSLEVFDLSPGCSREDIEEAYKKKVFQYHPDVVQGKGLSDDFIKFAEEKFKEIKDAHDYLCEIIKNEE